MISYSIACVAECEARDVRTLRIADCRLRIPAIQNPKSKIQNISQYGFTLVELMLVVVIIGVLAAMVIPRLAGRTEQAKIARAKSDIAAIGLALDLYELDIGSYPDSDSLKSLISEEGLPQGVDRAQWKGPYLKKGIPKDPWGRDYQYKKSQTAGKDVDLLSYGADGQPGGNDDITN